MIIIYFFFFLSLKILYSIIKNIFSFQQQNLESNLYAWHKHPIIKIKDRTKIKICIKILLFNLSLIINTLTSPSA